MSPPFVIAHLGNAACAGARRVVLTAAPVGAALDGADRVFVLLAQTMLDDAGPARRSALPMASRYEIALRVTTELVVLELRRMARTDFGAMRRRHANIQ
jgi:hypothetical protein